MEDDAVLYVFDTRDGESFFVCFGVPAGYQHDTHGTAFVDFQCPSVEVALCHAFQKLYQIALHTKHDTFGFRVAHAYIVFNDHRFAFHVD